MSCRCNWLRPTDPFSRRVLYVHVDPWLDSRTEAATLCGLAANPAAPVPVLLELLRSRPEAVPPAFRHRILALPLIEAMLSHANPRVRAALAANRRVDPQVRLQLLDDPDTNVTDRVRADRSLPLPVPDRQLSKDLDRLHKQWIRGSLTWQELSGEVTELLLRDPRGIDTAKHHPNPVVRQAFLGYFRLTFADPHDEILQSMLSDESAEVRSAAAEVVANLTTRCTREQQRQDLQGNGYDLRRILTTLRLSRRLVDELIAEDNPYTLESLAANPSMPADVVAGLVTHPETQVRRQAAEREDLTADQLARLAADPDSQVRTAVSLHPALTETQRAGIEIDATESLPYIYDDDEPPAHTVEQSKVWAYSVSPLLRRRAAQDPRLPGEAVTALAVDHDPGVRVRLAHHHPAAPPELLLRTFREYPGCSRGRLPFLPNFPRNGLAQFADDVDPAVRALVALDPEAAPALIDRLLTDTDPAVRRAMAACPQLPTRRITALLDHPELAEPAAANPSLPEPRMRDLLR